MYIEPWVFFVCLIGLYLIFQHKINVLANFIDEILKTDQPPDTIDNHLQGRIYELEKWIKYITKNHSTDMRDKYIQFENEKYIQRRYYAETQNGKLLESSMNSWEKQWQKDYGEIEDFIEYCGYKTKKK